MLLYAWHGCVSACVHVSSSSAYVAHLRSVFLWTLPSPPFCHPLTPPMEVLLQRVSLHLFPSITLPPSLPPPPSQLLCVPRCRHSLGRTSCSPHSLGRWRLPLATAPPPSPPSLTATPQLSCCRASAHWQSATRPVLLQNQTQTQTQTDHMPHP